MNVMQKSFGNVWLITRNGLDDFASGVEQFNMIVGGVDGLGAVAHHEIAMFFLQFDGGSKTPIIGLQCETNHPLMARLL